MSPQEKSSLASKRVSNHSSPSRDFHGTQMRSKLPLRWLGWPTCPDYAQYMEYVEVPAYLITKFYVPRVGPRIRIIIVCRPVVTRGPALERNGCRCFLRRGFSIDLCV